MEHFNPDSLTYILPMTVPLWISIYVYTRDPLNNQNRLTALTIFSLFTYFLLGAIQTSLQTNEEAWIFTQKIFIGAITLPGVFWFHLSVISFSQYKKSNLLDNLKNFAYIFAIISTILGIFSNLIFNYSAARYFESGNWPIQIPTGILYPIFFIIIIFFISLATYLFLKLSRLAKTSDESKRFLTHFFGSAIFSIAAIFMMANVLFGWFMSELPGAILILLGIVVIIYGSIRYKGLKTDSPILLDKEFISETAILGVFLLIYALPFFVFRLNYSFNLIMIIISIIVLVPLTHSIYDGLMSYARNIFISKTFLPPLATDEEVSAALRNLNKPEKLESSSLFRLKIVGKGDDSLEKLQNLIENAIEFYCPKEIKRNRKTLKYEILKMISDQVEEGQILWYLGFEEYPLGIAENGDGQKPRFAIASPTDYQATSRNAFIALKKEAIHDLAWRISYLEKHTK